MKDKIRFTAEELAGMTGEELIRLAEEELAGLTDEELEGASGGSEMHGAEYWRYECLHRMRRCKTVEELNACRDEIRKTMLDAKGPYLYPIGLLLDMCDMIYRVFLNTLERNNTAK